MRTILDHYGAKWHRDEQGVVTTAFDVPAAARPVVVADLYRQIRSMAAQVIRVGRADDNRR